MFRRIVFLWIFFLGIFTATSLLFTLLIATNNNARAVIKTAMVLPEFIKRDHYSFFDYIVFLPLRGVTADPIVKTVSFSSYGQEIVADLYLPTNAKKYGAVIVTVGIEIDRKDPRNVFLANIVARSGVAAFIPELPGLLSGRLIEEDIDHLTTAYKYLKTQPAIRSDKIGFLSFCGASTLSIIAASDPEIADEVAYVAANNLYFSNASIYQAMVEKKLVDGERNFPWEVDYKTVKVFNREHIEFLEDENDKKILRSYLVDVSQDVLAKRNFAPLPATFSAQLTSNGRKIYQLLTNNDPDQVEALLQSRPQSVKEGNSKMDAVPYINQLKTKVYVIADRGNTFQPFTDSKKFVDQIDKDKILYVETDILKNNLLVSDLPWQKAITQGTRIAYFVYQLILNGT